MTDTDQEPMEANAEKPEGGKAGRPTLYTTELRDLICARLAEGESLNGICRDEGMPAESTVRGWSLDPEHPISARYARAREVGYHKMFDELLDIADDSRNDFVERATKSGDPIRVTDEEAISRARLRVDTRKWMLAKALPKVYGDKLSAELTGAGGTPLMPEPHPRDLARAVLDILRAQIEGEAEPDDPDDLTGTNGQAAAFEPMAPPASPRIRRYNPQTGRIE